MLARTHLAFGLLIALLFLQYYNIDNIWLFLFSALLFSLIPDIDTPKSAVGREVKPMSTVIKFFVGHRTLFHSIWPLLLYFVFVKLSQSFALGLLVGYGSHLLLDLFTKTGLQLFFPVRYRIRGRLKTGGFTERVLFGVFVLSDVVLASILLL